MVTIACPRSFISIPLMRLSPVLANHPGFDLPQVHIETTSTGRDALDKLGKGADFALATEAAFKYMPPDQRNRVVEIGELMSHKVCSRVFFRNYDQQFDGVEKITKELREGKRGVLIAQSQTNYRTIAKDHLDKYPNTILIDPPYSIFDIGQESVDRLIGHHGDYVICLGLHSWLDNLSEKLNHDTRFSEVYRIAREYEEGFGFERYVLYAFHEAVRGEKRENLEALRGVIIYLNEFERDPSQSVMDAHSHLEEVSRMRLVRDEHAGNLGEYFRRIQLSIRPRLAARVASIWNDEVRALARGA